MGHLDYESLPRGLVLQHEAFLKTLDGHLLSAPIAKPLGRVLDVGTGTGIWAREFAAENPRAEVVGIDLFATSVTPPDNCRFLIQDAEKDWEIGDADFDVIHTRLVPFHAKEVPGVLRRCYEHLKPGGYIEMHEMWPPCRTDEPPGAPEHQSKVIEWSRLRVEAALKLGIDQAVTGQLPTALAEAGFVDVETHDYKWPIGSWTEDAKMNDVGTMFLEMLQLLKMDISKQLLANLGMEEHQIVDLVEEVGKELGSRKVYQLARVIWAKKPE